MTSPPPNSRRTAMASDARLLLFRQRGLPTARPGADCGCMDESYDVVVVGGGAAGLAGAVALARSLRSVLVGDAGHPRNAMASHVHNFLSRDGTPPAGIYAAGRQEVARYGGRVGTGRGTPLSRAGGCFPGPSAGRGGGGGG